MAGRELVATILSVSLQLRQLLHAQQQKAAVKLHLRLRWADLQLNKRLKGWCEPGVHGFGLGASPILLRFQLDRHSTKYTKDAGQFCAGGSFGSVR